MEELPAPSASGQGVQPQQACVSTGSDAPSTGCCPTTAVLAHMGPASESTWLLASGVPGLQELSCRSAAPRTCSMSLQRCTQRPAQHARQQPPQQRQLLPLLRCHPPLLPRHRTWVLPCGCHPWQHPSSPSPCSQAPCALSLLNSCVSVWQQVSGWYACRVAIAADHEVHVLCQRHNCGFHIVVGFSVPNVGSHDATDKHHLWSSCSLGCQLQPSNAPPVSATYCAERIANIQRRKLAGERRKTARKTSRQRVTRDLPCVATKGAAQAASSAHLMLKVILRSSFWALWSTISSVLVFVCMNETSSCTSTPRMWLYQLVLV